MVYIKVQIFDDKLLEGTEAFGVQLSIPNHHKTNGVKLGDPSRATVFIKDGEAVTLVLNAYIQNVAIDERPPTTRAPTTKPPITRPPATELPTTCKLFMKNN